MELCLKCNRHLIYINYPNVYLKHTWLTQIFRETCTKEKHKTVQSSGRFLEKDLEELKTKYINAKTPLKIFKKRELMRKIFEAKNVGFGFKLIAIK